MPLTTKINTNEIVKSKTKNVCYWNELLIQVEGLLQQSPDPLVIASFERLDLVNTCIGWLKESEHLSLYMVLL